MNYVNEGKRDILIFPKFKNLNQLELIRRKYDELYKILPPHITLAFPFDLPISDAVLKDNLEKVFKKVKPFSIKMKNISFHKDEKLDSYYMFLDFIEGAEKIIHLHNKIYNEVLETKLSFPYTPHITLGNVNNPIKIELNEEFETIVDEVVVEKIGPNEESNIIMIFKLGEKPNKSSNNMWQFKISKGKDGRRKMVRKGVRRKWKSIKK